MHGRFRRNPAATRPAAGSPACSAAIPSRAWIALTRRPRPGPHLVDDASLAMMWIGRDVRNTRVRLHHKLDRTNAVTALSQIENAFRSTRRRTAVEIATCPRQCAVALRSHFCRHTYRMVNLQANVLTSAQTSLADGSLGRVRARFHKRCVTTPVRSVRYGARRGLYECSTLGDKK